MAIIGGSGESPFILWRFFKPQSAHCLHDATGAMRGVLWRERWAVARCGRQQCDTEGGPWVDSTHKVVLQMLEFQ